MLRNQLCIFGNGKVVWIKDAQGNSGQIMLAEKEVTETVAAETSDLPF